jgi:hypothetical protein
MAVRVVDLLEVVDVHETEAQRRRLLVRGVQGHGEPELVRAVVADERQAVGVRVARRTA